VRTLHQELFNARIEFKSAGNSTSNPRCLHGTGKDKYELLLSLINTCMSYFNN